MPTLSSPYQTTEVHFSLEWFCPDNLLTKHKFYWINNNIFLVYAKNEEKIGNPNTQMFIRLITIVSQKDISFGIFFHDDKS